MSDSFFFEYLFLNDKKNLKNSDNLIAPIATASFSAVRIFLLITEFSKQKRYSGKREIAPKKSMKLLFDKVKKLQKNNLPNDLQSFKYAIGEIRKMRGNSF